MSSESLTVVVLGMHGEMMLARTLSGLRAQTDTAFRTVVIDRLAGPSDDASPLAGALEDVSSTWVLFLDGCTELKPDWVARFRTHESDDRLGAVGGVVRVFEGVSTTASWFDPAEKVSGFSTGGVDRSHTHDLPTSPMCVATPFLASHNMAVRTEVARRSRLGRVNPLSAPHGLAWCLQAHDEGLAVVFDSALEAARYVAPRPVESDPGARRPLAWNRGYVLSHSLSTHGNPMRRLFLGKMALLVGDEKSPGLLLAGVFALRPFWRRRWKASMSGKLAGLLDALLGR